MDNDDRPADRRKLKFAPRKPRRNAPKSNASDDGSSNQDEAAKAQKLMTKFNEGIKKQVNRADKKAAPVKVAFGSGDSPSSSIRKFGFPKAAGTSNAKASAAAANSNHDDAMRIDDNVEGGGQGVIDPDRERTRKKNKEPFENEGYPPITFPQDELNEQEYDENSINHASELGLLEESDEPKMHFFQLPPMPCINRSANSAKGKEKVGSSSGNSSIQSQSFIPLPQLPEGYMGKMVVFKSGAVKLKIGDVPYNVNQGSDCKFHEQVVAVNTATEQCSNIGEIEKHVVVSLDVLSILD